MSDNYSESESENSIYSFNNSRNENDSIKNQIENISVDEIKMLRHFTKSGDFTKFTNSYLIEINPKSTEKAIFYNNIRKDEYRLITKIYDKYVEKEIYTENNTYGLIMYEIGLIVGSNTFREKFIKNYFGNFKGFNYIYFIKIIIQIKFF